MSEYRGRDMLVAKRNLKGGKTDTRERSTSVGNIEDYVKRKRIVGEGGEAKEEEIFKRSKKIMRSPEKKLLGSEQGEGEAEGGAERLGGIIGKWKKEIEEMIKEMKVFKEWMEEIKGMKEEVKVEIQEQGVMLREEVDKMRKAMKAQKENWEKEREEMKRQIRGLEREILEIKERGIPGEERSQRKGEE